MYEQDVRHTKPAVVDPSGGGVVTRGLGKQFGDKWALRDLDLDVAPGTVLGLLGHNGAGKTTAIRILTTLSAPTTGSATVAGHDVVRDADAVRASIGVASQQATVDGLMSARKNLVMVGRLYHLTPKAAKQRADDLLEALDLADAADQLVKTFSGGMRRRLDLAAALVHEPPVLFLDEPTTGLDPQGRNGLWDVIENLVAGGTTVLLTTQYLEEADALADNIVVIDHGTVIAEGSAADLKARLGDTVIEIGFRDDADATTAAGLLASVGGVDRDGKVVHVSVPSGNGAGSMFQTVRTLDDAHLEPSTLLLREPTLDDVFLSLTGHAAEEAESGDDDGGGDGAVKTRRSRRARRQAK